VTGFTEFQLVGTGQAELYFSTLVGAVGVETTAQLLDTFNALATAAGVGGVPDERLRTEIFFDERLGAIARNVIKMWYVGTWYQLPPEWRARFGIRTEDTTRVVSPIAYTEGLLWRAIGANPSGARPPGYGAWENPPQIPPTINLPVV
jgi:hypothetical protein